MNNRTLWNSTSIQAFLASAGHEDPAKAIQIEAQKLIELAGITNPPIWIRRLKPFCGIREITPKKMTGDAVLVSHPDGFFIIVVNKDQYPTRQRFSCAHEIGHIFLEKHTDQTARTKADRHIGINLQNPEEEYFCNQAAAEILMPTKFFVPIARNFDLSITSLPIIAKRFWTSIQSTAIKLVQTNVWRCIVVIWKVKSRPDSTEELGVDWSISPEDIQCSIPRSCSMTRTSTIFDTYHNGKTHTAREYLELGNLKGEYYVESGRFGHDEQKYVLSLIFPESSHTHVEGPIKGRWDKHLPY